LKYFECNGSETADASGPIIVYTAPDEAERRRLVEDYKIDEHTLASALDPDELARLEFEPDHIAIIYKRPRNYSSRDGVLFKVSSIGLFLFRDRLIVVQSDEMQLFEAKHCARIHTLPQSLLNLLYRSIFHYLEHLKVMRMISEELERKISTAMENRYLLNLFGLEKSLVYYLSAINSNGMLVEKLKLNAAKIGFSPEELEFLDDVIIENTQCLRQAEIYSNILASLMDARVSVVSNNLNVLMKTLNIIVICLMVPTLVVSIFSMNVALPLNNTHPLAFWFIVGVAAATVVGLFYVWRRFWR